jgi:hypothetical protein
MPAVRAFGGPPFSGRRAGAWARNNSASETSGLF